MAVKRVIKGVYIIPMGMANAFLVEGDDALALIDAGFAHKEAAVFEAIRRCTILCFAELHIVCADKPSGWCNCSHVGREQVPDLSRRSESICQKHWPGGP
jgi:hypothetical protein